MMLYTVHHRKTTNICKKYSIIAKDTAITFQKHDHDFRIFIGSLQDVFHVNRIEKIVIIILFFENQISKFLNKITFI